MSFQEIEDIFGFKWKQSLISLYISEINGRRKGCLFVFLKKLIGRNIQIDF